jgi:hypothetical protein
MAACSCFAPPAIGTDTLCARHAVSPRKVRKVTASGVIRRALKLRRYSLPVPLLIDGGLWLVAAQGHLRHGRYVPRLLPPVGFNAVHILQRLAATFRKSGLKWHVGPIIVEQIHLNIPISRSIQTNLIHQPSGRIQQGRIGHSVSYCHRVDFGSTRKQSAVRFSNRESAQYFLIGSQNSRKPS